MLKLILLVSLAVSATFGSPVSSQSDDDAPELKWYKQYYVEVEKYSVLAGVLEPLKVWHTPLRSRVDYHDGITKKIIYLPKYSHSHYGIAYEIRPEELGEKPVCHKTVLDSLDDFDPINILPDTYGFEKVGNEEFRGLHSGKFERNGEESDTRETLWASYDHLTKIWIPLRYTKVGYSVDVGSMVEHDIWDFYDFKTKFSLSQAFDSYVKDCEDDSKTIQHDMNDEAVTKHLHFVDPDNEKHVDYVFAAFKNQYNKDYSDDEKDHAFRRMVFKNNLRIIAATNRQNLGYKLAVNQFSDKTLEEQRQMQGFRRRQPGQVGTKVFPYTKEAIKDALDSLPSEYDARDEGLVSPVKDQMTCGSCWTYGTTTAAEGAVARSAGRLMRLSNQALLDCSFNYGNDGCNGGTDVNAYKWMMDYGLPTEGEYGTYSNMESACNIHNMSRVYAIKGFVDVTPNSIGALKVALVNHGPLSVSVDVTQNFAQYSSGIFYDVECSETSLNHEVALVGYGERNGDLFWILKNSWGPEWGIGGYMMVAAKDNNCGVMTEPTYVFL